jgi:hypothetical protein
MPTPLYSCGKALETPEYVLLHCTEIAEKKKIMRQQIAFIALRTRRNLTQLTFKYPKFIIEWLLQTGKFALYNKARKLQRE